MSASTTPLSHRDVALTRMQGPRWASGPPTISPRRLSIWLPAWLPTPSFAVVRCGFRRFTQVLEPLVLRDFRPGATRREPGFAVLVVRGSGFESPQLHPPAHYI